MRSMVEGYRPAWAALDRWYPSTTFGGPPPRSGEDRYVRNLIRPSPLDSARAVP